MRTRNDIHGRAPPPTHRDDPPRPGTAPMAHRHHVGSVAACGAAGAMDYEAAEAPRQPTMPQTNSTGTMLIDEAALCKMLGIARSTARNWRVAGCGKGPGFVVLSRRCVRYDLQTVLAWIRAREVASTSEVRDDA